MSDLWIWSQALYQCAPDHFETLHLFSAWSIDLHLVLAYSFDFFFLHSRLCWLIFLLEIVSIIYIIFTQGFIIRGYPYATLLGCLVCVICNSKCFHSFIFKRCIMIVYTLKICTFYFVHISWIFLKNSHFWAVLNIDIFQFKMLRWCQVCVICNSNIIHSFKFKLCIIIVHTLNMCTF